MAIQSTELGIAADASVSAGFPLRSNPLVRLDFPPGFQGIGVVLQTAPWNGSDLVPGGPYADLVDVHGHLAVILGGAGRRVALLSELVQDLGFVRFRAVADLAGTDQPQAEVRSLRAFWQPPVPEGVTPRPVNLPGALIYQGTWDANANLPALYSGAGVAGHYYKVVVAGATNLDGNTGWRVGDFAAFNGSTWDHFAGGSGSAPFVGETPPPAAQANDLWWHSGLGRLFILFDDGSSREWVETNPPLGYRNLTHADITDWAAATAGFLTGITAAQIAAALTYTPANPASLALVATSGRYSDLLDPPALFSGAYADLTGKPLLGALAGQSSITHDQISDWAGATAGFSGGGGDPLVTSVAGRTGDVTLTHADLTDWASATAGFLTSVTGTEVLAALGYIPVDPASLAPVATSGHYADLSGTPVLSYDLACFVEGVMVNNETVTRFVAPRSFTLGAAGHYARAGTASAGSVTLTIAKNGTTIGSISFSAGGQNGTVTLSAATSFVAGDRLTIIGPATADSALADIGITLAGTRS